MGSVGAAMARMVDTPREAATLEILRLGGESAEKYVDPQTYAKHGKERGRVSVQSMGVAIATD